MSLNAPYTPNTVIQSTQVSNDLTGLANGSNDTSTNSMSTFRSEATYDFIASGGIWSGDSYGGTRNASMTIAVAYIGGVRIGIGSVAGRLFTASKDTYIDSTNGGLLVYTEVTNNSASPALAAGSIRMGIIVTGASNIFNAGSVNQGQENMILPAASSIAYSVTDSLGNLICPRDPSRKILGYRQITTAFTSATNGSYVNVTGLQAPVIIPSGRKIIVKSGAQYHTSSAVAGTFVELELYDNTAAVEIGGTGASLGGASYAFNPLNEVTVTPTVTSKTYLARIKQNGAGTMNLNAALTSPAWIKIELA